jgi:hypothetical protein
MAKNGCFAHRARSATHVPLLEINMRFAFAPSTRAARVVLLVAVVFSAPLAWGAQGAGSLFVAGATHNPTHWDIPVPGTTTAEIRGVLASEIGGSLTPTLTVIVKSSNFGNTVLVATRIGVTSNYTFDYTPPADRACATVIVAYFSNGQNCNNDLIDDGLQNGSSDSAAGFRFKDANGDTIPCTKLGVDARPWSSVKALYQH